MATTVSSLAEPFIASHEGFVSKAYRDSGGLLTIGYGFTMGSKLFANYWKAKTGRALKMGDTISRAEADKLLAQLIASEYAPPVDARFADTILVHQFDGSASMSFNCGPGTLNDRWAAALAAGDIAQAAILLRKTRITAGGKVVTGLIRRRADEARLIENGDYGSGATVPAAVSQGTIEVKDYQEQLKALGIYTGAIDGLEASSHTAVIRFQRQHNLMQDGVVGPATRATLRRAVEALSQQKVGAAVAVGSGSAAGSADAATSFDWGTVITFGLVFVAVAVAVVVVSLIWRHRGAISKQRTPT